MPTKKEEGTAMAPVEEMALTFSAADFADLATASNSVAGLENIDSSDIVMPKVKLLQATSLESNKGLGRPGEFLNTTTGEVADMSDLILLCMQHSRIRFKQPFNRGEAPLCRSLDGIKSTDGVLCKTCQYADWDNIAEGKTKPDCNLGYTWLAMPYSETGEYTIPFRIIIAGAGISEMKKFITNVNCTASPLGLPMWVFRYSATSEQVEKDGNIFYVPKFSMKKNADGSPMFINPKFKDQIKGVFESWTAMMSQINKFDLDNADEMASADTEGAIF